MTTKKRERMDPRDRRAAILSAAITEAEKVGYQNVRRENIAARAGVSVGLISKYFKTMGQLKRDIVRHGVKSGNVAIVAQGLALRDSHAMKAPEELKERAVQSLHA